MTKRIWTGFAAVLLMVVPLAAQKPEAAESLLQTAIKKEVVDGNLPGAIEGYQKALAAAKGNRSIEAKTLIRMAECYQKLGDAQSRAIYERVVREFADQPEAAGLARARLGRITGQSSSIATRQVWTGSQVAIYASISPDGRFLSFVDQQTGNLALHEVASGKDRALTRKKGWEESGEYAEASTFSRDGKRLAYMWFNKERKADLRLMTVAADNTQPEVLYANEDVSWIAPKDWSPDGNWIAVKIERKDHTSQIGLVDVRNGSLRVLKSVGWGDSHKVLFSPDGRYLAFDLQQKESSQERDVFTLATDGSREISVVRHPSDDMVVGWAPDGKHLLFTSDRTGSVGVYAIAWEEGKPAGAAKLIKSDMGRAASVGLTQSGVLYFALLPGSRDLLVASFDFDAGRVLKPHVPAVHQFLGTNYGPDWSPDGRHLSYVSYRFRNANVLEIHTAETGQARQLRPPLRYFNQPRWSPDGQSLLASGVDLKGRQGVYRISAQTGVAEAIVLSDSGIESQIPQWAADGRKIFYRRGDPARNNDAIVELELGSGTERAVLKGTEVRWFSVAPDGSHLACATWDAASKESSIFILDFTTGEKRVLVPPNSGFNKPSFTPDGRLILLQKQGEIWAVPPAGGTPRKVDLGLKRILELRVHPDGRQLAVMTRNDTQQEVWVAENILSSLVGRK